MATPALLAPQPLAARAPFFSRHQPRWLALHVLLLLITLTTTTLVGMRYMDNFRHGRFPLATEDDILPVGWLAANFRHLASGLPFALTLLGILLAHELAHYAACRRYRIAASLPYLIPAPSLSGTAGAVIRLRTRIHSRAALMAIGASGPIAGFVVAVITSIIGLALSVPTHTEPAHLLTVDTPLLMLALRHALGPMLHQPATGPLVWHPILIASWIGLLVTSLNLIPAGQLDGGHILYALSPRAHRQATSVVIVVLFVLGCAAWAGWLLWMGLLLIPAMRHPTVRDTAPLKPAHMLLAPACLAIFLLTATPAPFQHANIVNLYHWLAR